MDSTNERGIDYTCQPDEALAALSQTGDAMAQDFLIDKFKPLVKRKAQSYFLAGADREDIMQEGMIGLYKAIRDYSNDRGGFQSFALLCVTRQIITAIKTANRQKHLPLNNYVSLNKNRNESGKATIAEMIPADSASEPEEVFIGREGKSRIEAHMSETLSGFETEVLFHFLQGESYARIGERLDSSAKSVDNALQRVRRKLAKLL